MFKTKLKTFILLFTILTLICSFSFATEVNDSTVTNAVTDGTVVEGTTEETTDTEATAEENIFYGDLYKFEENIEIEGMVDGNVFAFGNNITIKEQTVIGGDLFVFGENVTINKSAVYGNIFAFATNLTVEVEAYDLYAACDTLNVGYYSVFHREIKAYASTVNMNGIALKNANFACDTLNIQESCVIYENLNYTSDSETTIPEGTVKGEVNYSKFDTTSGMSTTDTVLSYVWDFVMALVYTLVIWLFVIKFAPKFTEKISGLKTKKVLPAIGLGIVGLIVMPIVSIILLFTYVGIPLAFALLVLYGLIISISFTMTAIFVANIIKNRVNKGKTFVYVILSTLILWALTQIPYAGAVLSMIITVIGFGIFVMNVFSKKAKENVETTVAE